MSCLPYVTVQHDYPQVFDDIASGVVAAERVWVSVYALNAPSASIHARLLLVSDEPERQHGQGVEVEADGGGSVYIAEITPPNQLKVDRVKNAPKNVVISSVFRPAEDSDAPPPTSVRFPQQRIYLPPVLCLAPRFTLPFPGSVQALRPRKGVSPHISAFDVSPTTNGLYVAGGPDGKCWIGRLPQASGSVAGSTSKPLVLLEGHVGDVTSARFFPSGEVVITTSSDFHVCIFSAVQSDESKTSATSPPINAPVRTLTAHTRAPTTSVILGRGRIVLTGGRDGYIRCWNVGEGREIGNLPASEAVLTSLFGPTVESMIVGADPTVAATEPAAQAGEDTEVFPGRLPLLAVGLNSGEIILHDLRRGQLASRSSASTAPESRTIRIQPSETIRTVVKPPSFPPGLPLAASDAAQAWAGPRNAGSVLTLAWDSRRHLLVAGYSTGLVAVFNISQLLRVTPDDGSSTSPPEKSMPSDAGLVALWKRNDASINHIELVSDDRLPKESNGGRNRNNDTNILRLIATTSDGLACRLSLDVSTSHQKPAHEGVETSNPLATPSLEAEYLGWESGDGIAAAKLSRAQGAEPDSTSLAGQTVALAGADGMVRVYSL